MLPEIGLFSLIIALCMSLVLAIVPQIGVHKGIAKWIAVAKPVAIGQLAFVLLSYLCLTYAFITHDFSIEYVALNSNTHLPFIYRIAAVWGSHEGSLLLWVLILSIWTTAVAIFSKALPIELSARVLAVMGAVAVGFMLFIVFTSNPFLRVFPIPAEGKDLNPLLQDPGMAIHPPMLYMGYVGFSVAFAFSIAALLNGKLDAAWVRWTRPWTAMAWTFLTTGIVLGSWWAYYELGWGGWWFWDPVENASFMPWLVGTALIHSLAVTEKRGMFKNWTILLSVFAFSLSLLGTFLVRSGVLTSVHAFASDPTRGIFILVFLGVVVGGSLTLFAWRGPKIHTDGHFEIVSRESLILVNNVLLVSTAATILLGTLYPLVIDALGLGKISVGPPYFNSVFIPLTAPLACFVSVGMLARWRQDNVTRFASLLWLPLLVSITAGLVLSLLQEFFSWGALIGLTLAVWTGLTSWTTILARIKDKTDKLAALAEVPLSIWAMSVAHFGIAVFIVGITLTSIYTLEKDIRLSPGQSMQLAGYDFVFHGVNKVAGANYDASEGHVSVTKNGASIAELHPQKRIYRASGMPMTEAGIDATVTRDLFVALGEPLDNSGDWALRVYFKPFVRWIWVGGLFMAMGGLLAVADKRYRKDRKQQVA
ncbi:MAG: heme lyase CcmF/NrfE family subunit [Methylococcales bacterium]|nr:heme lyase CcmF/NrfE family subunit [Methylococcaceae bacterium]